MGLKTPALLLGIRVPDHAFERPELWPCYETAPGRTWHKVVTRAGQYGFTHHRYLATVLTPAAGVTMAAAKLHSAHSSTPDRPSLDQVVSYRQSLRNLLGVDCAQSYGAFSSFHYPIDVEHVTSLTGDSLPANLDDLLEWQSGLERARLSVGRWSLVIVA